MDRVDEARELRDIRHALARQIRDAVAGSKAVAKRPLPSIALCPLRESDNSLSHAISRAVAL